MKHDFNIDVERRFKPEIEGLRIVAALLVAIYHIWFNKVSGGVDVFFVISGFLITTSIISKLNKQGELKAWPYFRNLMKRLLPSVLTILFIVSILSFLFLPESILVQTIKEIIASLFYFENWQLAFSNTDYLAQDQMKTPVEHFWAMSIQGQFYIIWFLLFSGMIILAKSSRKVNLTKLINIVLGILFITSFSFSVYQTIVNQPFAYFNVAARVWEFALGGLLCMNISKFKLPSWLSVIIGWLGLIMLIITGMLFNVSTMFPGYIALWPMVSAIFIMIAGNNPTNLGVEKFLGSRPMIKLGGISFGIYLWHWVILSFYRYNISTKVGILQGIAIILVSILLSYLMTRFIESPVRNCKQTPSIFKRLIPMFIVSALTISVLGVRTYAMNKASSEINSSHPGAMALEKDFKKSDEKPIPSFAKAKEDNADAYKDGYDTKLKKSDLKVGEYGETENYKKTIVLSGASHTTHYLGALQELGKKHNYRILSITKSGCRLSSEQDDDPGCAPWRNKAMKKIIEIDPDLVVTLGTITQEKEVPKGFIDYFKKFKEHDIDVMATRDTPRYKFSIPNHLEKLGEQKTIKAMNQKPQLEHEQEWKGNPDIPDNVHFVDYKKYFMEDGKFKPVIGNVIVYFDKGHISNTYAKSMGPIMYKDIKEIIEEKK
ncbi:acyltransferase family protein [Staphylococcus massiliensis]|uniref:acyltransferase family protein n=1 Tax=Staphylococcus massiliensis TaxID=555791 RepID=UPI001EDED914|nr:acyltransferase family protein [Staphylococcus massiliensis]MCG3400469.1 acyltransferase [Staphylococcus massiliensis]